MPTRGEAIGMTISLVLLVLSYVIPGGRVLTIPFFFVLVLIMIFWSARVSAEREER
jgi:hypothetical protein